ncbi:hypothetical protein DUNSADRAFT_4248 [Dunaliella salina]|uniref:Encoded protein n=1 Tax=Dunaliella salina TaxID=3046 RepID=A0ABQ7GSB1_DUNSA|nr:hypothetical protein DUNSADRAFT_4248 [Dunaliella salina]|eukprot:KAF5837501.1 hypothetical protein DUNSADRAFT_4248 [Dunaliella salina]
MGMACSRHLCHEEGQAGQILTRSAATPFLFSFLPQYAGQILPSFAVTSRCAQQSPARSRGLGLEQTPLLRRRTGQILPSVAVTSSSAVTAAQQGYGLQQTPLLRGMTGWPKPSFLCSHLPCCTQQSLLRSRGMACSRHLCCKERQAGQSLPSFAVTSRAALSSH